MWEVLLQNMAYKNVASPLILLMERLWLKIILIRLNLIILSTRMSAYLFLHKGLHDDHMFGFSCMCESEKGTAHWQGYYWNLMEIQWPNVHTPSSPSHFLLCIYVLQAAYRYLLLCTAWTITEQILFRWWTILSTAQLYYASRGLFLKSKSPQCH